MENNTIALRVTQASLNQTSFDWPRNMANIYAAIDEAVAQNSDILALEEMTLVGYDSGDDFQKSDNNRILAALDDVAAYAKALDPNLIISIGHPWRIQNRELDGPMDADFERVKDPFYDRLNKPFNVQTILTGGSIIGMNAKTNLYNDGRGYEGRYFNEWNVAAANRIGGVFGTIPVAIDETRTVPFGCPVFLVTGSDEKAFYLSQAICETKWVATRYDGYPHDDSRYDRDNIIPSMARYIGDKDGSILLISNASPPARDKVDAHIHLNKLAAKYFGTVVDTDGLGSSGSTFSQYGNRMVVQGADIRSFGSRINFTRVATTTSAFNIKSVPEEKRGKEHVAFAHAFKDHDVTDVSIMPWRKNPDTAWDMPENPDRHFEEEVRNSALWLFDYLRKTGGKGVMEALSGGADSAYNSVLTAAMVHIGIHELGVEQFCRELKLPFVKEAMSLSEEAAIKFCIDKMLTCVYLGTGNNAKSSYIAADYLMNGGIDVETGKEIAGIGGKFESRNIQDAFNMLAVIYAVPDSQKIPESQKQEFIEDITAYLHANPNILPASEIEAMGKNLQEKYPVIDRLITASDGTVYENMQAWLRMVIVRAYAQMERKVPVANPNLDEIRNGYTTVGGDEHSGNIGLNAHLEKHYELNVMRYLHKHGLQNVMPPVRALGKVLNEVPSAGLMPLGPNGEVVQTDEDSLQRTYPEMSRISNAQLHDRIDTLVGARRLNAFEVFETCQKDPLFEGIDDDTLYNKVRMTYNRWPIAQHKIHMGVIAQANGVSADHQVSQRTPNLSGQSKDELSWLSIKLLYKWAERDGLDWSATDLKTLERRTWQDENFFDVMDSLTRVKGKGQEYSLKGLYEQVKEKGWNGVFDALPPRHPVSVVGTQSFEMA